MDTGTFYLYEYENNVRKRNAGFLKIYRRYQSCIFQAHIRSISLENVFEAEMYAFFFKENQICAKQIAHFPIDSMTHSIRFCAPRMPPSRIDRRVFPEMFRVILPLAYAELS